ncbi:plasmid mobilization protein [Inconstantimicrobium mannanitabidum]|uniref:Uncharacterized protein n=1 Tax=Inconstantimicrobium mannanitabidum TaxID=1604901 RepID=A0ACB5RIR2_9CLOT|nr:hypothetical protein [Clostridium sp. TW13]GKX68990.1 hypothetical protein rsdtw13_42480 [Clostridium sp. TW13]
MKETKSELLQIRLTELEKKVIKDKADLLGITVSDYVKECCVYSNVSEMFINQLHKQEII